MFQIKPSLVKGIVVVMEEYRPFALNRSLSFCGLEIKT